jgi:hypothetical protein
VLQSRRPRLALARLLNQMRDGLFPLEHDDVVALRHLRKAIESIVNERSTEQLIESGSFAVANLHAVPFTLIVAFEQDDETSTVLDAADTLMRNLHHPSRAATRWDQSAGHAEIRDEIVAKLYDTGDLKLGEALLLGPRFEEAALRPDQPAEPIGARWPSRISSTATRRSASRPGRSSALRPASRGRRAVSVRG